MAQSRTPSAHYLAETAGNGRKPSYIARGLLGGVALIPASSPEEPAAYFDLNKVIRIEGVR